MCNVLIIALSYFLGVTVEELVLCIFSDSYEIVVTILSAASSRAPAKTKTKFVPSPTYTYRHGTKTEITSFRSNLAKITDNLKVMLQCTLPLYYHKTTSLLPHK